MGPLAGVKVVELVGSPGPGPFAGMLLADMGAEVIRVDRMDEARAADRSRPASGAMIRSKRSVAVDLKHPDGVAAVLRLAERADAFIEVFRPGVAERLGVGPADCMARNPRLVYGRLTGWGRDGPYAPRAGHDITYVALSGALDMIGEAGGPPVPPVTALGDFAGGGMLLAFGMACALVDARASGEGQVVDAAMVDGAALMMTPYYAGRASGFWGERGTNFLDGAAPFYQVYETADGKWVAVGAIEPQFYAELMRGLGRDDADLSAQWDRERWPAEKERMAAIFRTRTRDEWCALLEHTDACFAPVLTPVEAAAHPHAVARRSFLHPEGLPQPAPAPRFSRTPAEVAPGTSHPGDDGDAVLGAHGFSADEIAKLRDAGAVW